MNSLDRESYTSIIEAEIKGLQKRDIWDLINITHIPSYEKNSCISRPNIVGG